MVTIRERRADYLFHYVRCAIFIELFKRIVVLASINEFDVYWHKPFSYKQIIIDRPSDTTVAVDERVGIFERKMHTRNALNDVFVAPGVLFFKQLF